MEGVRKIISSERYEHRFKRGRVMHKCTLECGHQQRGGNDEVKNGELWCVECWRTEMKKEGYLT